MVSNFLSGWQTDVAEFLVNRYGRYTEDQWHSRVSITWDAYYLGIKETRAPFQIKSDVRLAQIVADKSGLPKGEVTLILSAIEEMALAGMIDKEVWNPLLVEQYEASQPEGFFDRFFKGLSLTGVSTTAVLLVGGIAAIVIIPRILPRN